MDEINRRLQIICYDNPLDYSDAEAERLARHQLEAGGANKATKDTTGNAKPQRLETVFTSGQDSLDNLLCAIDKGAAEPLIRLTTFPEFELGPGLITIIGAPPAAGKTLMSMQMMFEGIERDESLIAYVANCEMTPQSLLRRELTRLTNIPAKTLRYGNLDDEARELLRSQTDTFRHRLERVQFVPADPRALSSLTTAKPGLVLLDYLQRFPSYNKPDPRQAMNEMMTFCRRLADLGHSVLAISATKRTQDGRHSNAELSLSSFRESGEIEYAADACYVLKTEPQTAKQHRPTQLVCVKNRHEEQRHISLALDAHSLSFIPGTKINESNQLPSRPNNNDESTGFCYGGDQ